MVILDPGLRSFAQTNVVAPLREKKPNAAIHAYSATFILMAGFSVSFFVRVSSSPRRTLWGGLHGLGEGKKNENILHFETRYLRVYAYPTQWAAVRIHSEEMTVPPQEGTPLSPGYNRPTCRYVSWCSFWILPARDTGERRCPSPRQSWSS